ncbi:protein-tyrosine phosphatase-like protein [Xylariomycetidae sp. FL2044]|nr:protein-tyrosine phosphatase-like protein [Xylariomycetidae sp. FL2044]
MSAPFSNTAKPVPSAPYSMRPPSPPQIVIPTPVHLGGNQPIKVVPNYTHVDPSSLSIQDLMIITQNGKEQIAHDSAVDWNYESRRAAQPILDYLYLGPLSIARNREWLQRNGITMVLAARQSQMAGARLMMMDKIAQELGIEADYVDVEGAHDLIRALPTAIQKINNHMLRIYRSQSVSNPEVEIQDGNMIIDNNNFRRGKVLVFCETGNDRSAAVVVAYLMSVLGLDLISACQYIHYKRFCVSLGEDMKHLLKTFEGLLMAQREVHGYEAMRRGTDVSKGSAVETTRKKSKRGFEDTMDMDDEELGGMTLDNFTDQDRFNGRNTFTPFIDA